MTRAEVIATVERVARENGWHIWTDDNPRRIFVQTRATGECEPPCAALVSVSVPLAKWVRNWVARVTPELACAGDERCAEAVADWHLIQNMTAHLREALGTPACTGCHGTGRRPYGTTLTYHEPPDGGFAGMAVTEDTCDECWGSGWMTKPNPEPADRYEYPAAGEALS